MPAAFATWTVLPHEPLQKLAENLWFVTGTMPDGSTRRNQTLVRLRDGRVVIHNAIALEEPLMAEIEAWGEPAAILVPNGFHRQDARIMKDRYPRARVYCPAGAVAAVRKVVPVDGSYADAPGDDTVTVRHLKGTKDREGVIDVRSLDGRTLVLNDCLCDVHRARFPFNVLLAPLGRPAVPRISRWMIAKDRAALKQDLLDLATPDLRRLVPGHGPVTTEQAVARLRTAADDLG